jgi:putative flavoprotein involved in K+ transport
VNQIRPPERVGTVVIGGGQAGLSVGYHLARRRVPFVILDRNMRIGDAWRTRWDSLRLFTPARYDGLPGMKFPAPAHSMPTKKQMADYLEAYAAKFELPVRTGVTVRKLSKLGDRFLVGTDGEQFEAENVVVAMSNYQMPKVPAFAAALDPRIVQLHSSEYRNPTQLQEGGVLVVGAGNSGAEIALELSRSHSTWMSGRDTGQVPFRIGSVAGRYVLAPLALRVVFHRVLTVRTPLGRRARPRILSAGGPLIRTRSGDLIAAGVQRVPRTVGIRDGLPLLDDDRVLDVANVIWCTGYQPSFDWIDLPVLGVHEPLQQRGIVPTEPGLYFVGLEFLYSFSSVMVHGVERDANRIARIIAARAGATVPKEAPGHPSRPLEIPS